MGKVTHPQLIKIVKTDIGAGNVNSVNARDIWEYLEVKTNFSNWIKRAIEKYDFVENEDFLLAKNGIQKKGSGGYNQIDYIVTIDMAKELAMLENNVKGKETRKYFIQIEKEFKVKNLPTPLETAKLLVQVLEEKEALLLSNKKLESHNAILMHTNKLYTATEIAKEVGFKSATTLNNRLNDLHIQYKVNRTWVLSSKYSDLGYTSIKQEILENGKEIYDRKWTQLGRDFILKLYKENKLSKEEK